MYVYVYTRLLNTKLSYIALCQFMCKECIRNFVRVQLEFYIICLARNKFNICAYLKTMPTKILCYTLTQYIHIHLILLAWCGGINMYVYIAFKIKCSPYSSVELLK